MLVLLCPTGVSFAALTAAHRHPIAEAGGLRLSLTLTLTLALALALTLTHGGSWVVIMKYRLKGGCMGVNGEVGGGVYVLLPQ